MPDQTTIARFWAQAGDLFTDLPSHVLMHRVHGVDRVATSTTRLRQRRLGSGECGKGRFEIAPHANDRDPIYYCSTSRTSASRSTKLLAGSRWYVRAAGPYTDPASPAAG